jgi:hypothetical protein
VDLKVVRFRVENFRNIDDSGWIPVEQVTAFVGRNESGKTTLLKALHKFNPSTPEPIRPQRDFPRDRFTSDFGDPAKWSFCSVEFAFDDGVREALRTLLDGVEPPTGAVCKRWYNGALTIDLLPAIEAKPLSATSVVEGLDAFASAARRLEKLDEEADEAAAARRGAPHQSARASL